MTWYVYKYADEDDNTQWIMAVHEHEADAVAKLMGWEKRDTDVLYSPTPYETLRKVTSLSHYTQEKFMSLVDIVIGDDCPYVVKDGDG